MRRLQVLFASIVLAHPAVAATAADSHALPALPPDAEAQVSAALGRQQASYHASPRAHGLHLENPQHGLSAGFTPAGVQVRAVTGTWGWTLLSYGYGDDAVAPIQVAPRARANRVEYRRGDLIEWYVNGPLGLEQGFTFASAPGRSTGAPLTLTLRLSGNLVASADAAKTGAILSGPDGAQALHYRGLTAFDATGRELPAWLDVENARLSLRVDDTGAQYPVVVDPFIQQVKLTAPDGATGDRFGGVAIDGDTLVVGATADDVDGNVDQGSVYVFVRPAAGWREAITHQARLIASDGAAGAVFGNVAVSGDTIVVGATGCPNPNVCNTQPVAARGAAYVFVRPVGGWSGTLTEQAKLVASDGASNDVFGASVSVEGDTVVVSSEWDDTFRGSAYVFVRPAEGWSGTRTENSKLIASDRAPQGNGIGHALGRAYISGDIIVAGALGADVVGADGFSRVDAGRAYVFVRPAAGWSGTRTENARLIASDRAANDRFGASVAASGDTIAVGAPFDSGDETGDHGAVYVFLRPAGGWTGTLTENARLIASDQQANDLLGNSVRMNGDRIIAAAPLADSLLGLDTGAAYLFEPPAGGWSGTLTEAEKLTASDGVTGDRFSSGMAWNGDTIVVGAVLDDVDANADQGSVYVFDAHRPARLTLTPVDATNPVGTSHTLTARVADSDDVPNEDALVRFTISGTVSVTDSCMTDANGQCNVSYDGPTAPGSDAIAAFADTDGDGTQDDGEPTATAAKSWVAAAPAALTLTPESASNPVNTEHCVLARVSDAFANATPGVLVRFSVSGSVAASGSTDTDAEGATSFCYAGPQSAGTDDITAFADADEDGTMGANEPSASATKTWNAPVEENARIAGAGLAPGATSRGDLLFALFAQRAGQELNGSCLIVDAHARVVLVCRDVTALAREGTHASVSGNATLNGEPTTYQIEVDDVADPGRGRDTFTIRTPSGYVAGGLLRFGNVQVEE